jgi:hypothetical protein
VDDDLEGVSNEFLREWMRQEKELGGLNDGDIETIKKAYGLYDRALLREEMLRLAASAVRVIEYLDREEKP